MNDKELLELAAKAAGYEEFIWGKNFGTFVRGSNGVTGPWNPLFNDGDAFRLAAKLHMSVSFCPAQSDACTIGGLLSGNSFLEKHEDHSWNVESATRLAIVRAAAEIGKSL